MNDSDYYIKTWIICHRHYDLPLLVAFYMSVENEQAMTPCTVQRIHIPLCHQSAERCCEGHGRWLFSPGCRWREFLLLLGETRLSFHPRDEIRSRFLFLEAKESKKFVMHWGVFHVGSVHADLFVQVYFLTSRYDLKKSNCLWQKYAVLHLSIVIYVQHEISAPHHWVSAEEFQHPQVKGCCIL